MHKKGKGGEHYKKIKINKISKISNRRGGRRK